MIGVRNSFFDNGLLCVLQGVLSGYSRNFWLTCCSPGHWLEARKWPLVVTSASHACTEESD